MIDLVRLAEVMSINPARIGGYEGQGRGLSIGSPAHIALVDTHSESHIDATTFASKSSNSPFHGMTLVGKVRTTLFHGIPVFRDGKLTGARYTA